MLIGFLSLLGFLALLSLFFSASETAFVAVNKHELAAEVNKKSLALRLTRTILAQPEKMLSLILLGNNFANVLFTAFVTFLTISYVGENFVFVASVLTTFFILIMCEVLPKTFAFYYPNKMALGSSFILYPLLKILYPFILVISAITFFIQRVVFASQRKMSVAVAQRRAAIKGTVLESQGILPSQQTNMLLSVLELDSMRVEEIMRPLHTCVSINLSDSLQRIKRQLEPLDQREYLIYRRNLNHCLGFVTAKQIKLLLRSAELSKRGVLQLIDKPTYIPASMRVFEQLDFFIEQQIDNALVVDEYGELQGIVSLHDMITSVSGQVTSLAKDQYSNAFIATGDTSLREINQKLGVDLDLSHAKTLQGLVYERLESLPTDQVCILEKDIRIEILKLDKGRIIRARLWHN